MANPYETCASDTSLWCREDPPSGVSGFMADFIAATDDYCSRRDALVLLCWDGLGHFGVDGLCAQLAADEGSSVAVDDLETPLSSAPSAGSPSSSEMTCYWVEVLGRFFAANCSSSPVPSSSSCGYVCQRPDWPIVIGAGDAEQEARPLRFCFDELGHLVSIQVCGRYRWHQHDQTFDGDPSDADDPNSVFAHEGAVVEVFLPVAESSSPASSSCTPLRSSCEPIAVYRLNLVFDSLGHLYRVTIPVLDALPCGVEPPCCDGKRLPKVLFTVWEIGFCNFPGQPPVERCTLAVWDGCRWRGSITLPCCHFPDDQNGPPSAFYTMDFYFACTEPDPPDLLVPWRFCLDGQPQTPAPAFACCPVDGQFSVGWTREGCSPVCIGVFVMEVPCDPVCSDLPFFCPPEVTSSTGILPSFPP